MKYSPAVAQSFDKIRDLSAVAHREVEQVLPAIARHGDDVALQWLAACTALFSFERDAGKAFIRGSLEAEKVSEEVLPWTGQAMAFMQWRASWRALEGFMANVARAYGSLGHAGEKRWAEIGFGWCARQIESGAAYFSTPVLDIAGRHGGIAAIEQIAAPAEELFESRKLMLSTYLPGAIRVRNLLGAQAILPWASRGADILQSGRARGEAYFRLESEESLSLLLEHLPGYRLTDRNRLLGMLLDVWFGGEFDLRESTWSPEKGRPFIETDGRSIYFPAVMADREEAILALLHTAGHLRGRTFDRGAMREMFAEAKIDFPETGAVSWAPLFLRFGEDALRFQLLFDLCEDLRVDCGVQRGVPNYLRRLQRAARGIGARHPETAAYYDLALESIGAAIAHHGGSAADPRFASLLQPGATVADAWRAAVRLHAESTLPPVTELEAFLGAYLPGRSPNAARMAHPQESDEQSQQTQAGSEQQSGQQDEGGQETEAPQNAESGDQRDDGEKKEMPSYGDSSGQSARASSESDKQGPNQGSSDKGIPYPEWDYRESRYKRNWSWVQEKRLAESNMGETSRLMKQYELALKRLKKAIQSQKPTRMAPLTRQLDGDDMDLNAVVTFVAEKRAGQSPRPAIYKRREIRQREVAVTLLADMSTSIMQHLPEGGGRLVDRIRAGVLLFAESMEEVGDAYSIAGFCSKYRDNVSYYTLKGFGESLTDDVRAQIGGMSGRLATRMGAAIRHATARFDGIESRRRLLLLLSDGRPEDYDDGGDRRYLHEDTRMAVKEAVAKGIHPFCVTVDTMANQYLPQIFGPGHYLVLDHINSLPNKLPEIYLRLRR
ncbi:MAG: VWA domain-containing protein [Burkholderiales bacterium]|nr:VWA domain-containing protein [Burkholderiales bacterium]